MSHSEKCRKRFIEKEKLDKQLEEATRNTEPPPVIAAEIDVEQPHEQPSTGFAFFCAVPSGGGTLPSPSSHEVRMEVTEPSGSTRPLEGGDESSSKRVRSLAGMLLFDENETSDWQHSIREAHMSELSNDQHVPENIIDHMQQPDTDIPGVWSVTPNLKIENCKLKIRKFYQTRNEICFVVGCHFSCNKNCNCSPNCNCNLIALAMAIKKKHTHTHKNNLHKKKKKQKS